MRIPQLADFKNKHILALLGNFVISGFSFLTIGLLARSFESKADLGIWFFFLTIYALADAMRNGLLTTATIKFYAGAPAERGNPILGSVWLLAIAITALFIVIDLGAFYFIGDIKDLETRVVIQWFGITILSSLPYNVTFWILLAQEDYLTILWLRLVNSGSMIVIIFILFYLKQASLQNILLVNFLTNCLTSVVCFVFGLSKFRMIFKCTSNHIKEVFAFGKFSMASNISSNLLGAANTFIINHILGEGVLATFGVAYKFMEAIEIPLRSFVGTGMSSMASALNNNNMYHLTFVSKKYAGMLTLVFIPIAIGTFLFADLPIWLLGGSKYLGTEAPNVLRFMMCIAVLYPIDRFNGVTLDILHQPKINFYKVMIMGAFNITVAFVACTILKNVYGVVLATLAATLAGIFFGYYHLRKYMQYSFRGIIVTGAIELRNFFIEKILGNKLKPANTKE